MAINFKEEQVRVEYVVGEDTVRESISDTIIVPSVKPDIERVLEVRTNILYTEVSVEDGGVLITGEIEVGVLYVADDSDQPVHFFESTLPINNFVEIPEAKEGMNAYIDVDIIRASYNFTYNPEGNNRNVEVSAVIKKFAKVLEYRQIKIITDVTGIREELVEKELLRIQNVIAENTYTVVVEGIISVPERKPPVGRVLKVGGGLITGVEVEIIDDAVIVKGDFEGGIMYVAAPEDGNYTDQPVHFAEDGFTFEEVLDLPGAEPGMSVYATVKAKKWDYTISSDQEKEVEVRAVVEIFSKVLEPRQIMVVTDIDSDRVEIEEELLRVEEVIGENTLTETINKQLNVPEVKPNIERILGGNAQLYNGNCTAEDGGVLIEFDLEGSVLYVAAPTDIDNDGDVEYTDQSVHYFHKMIEDVANFVEIPDAEIGMNCYGDVNVKKVRVTKLGPKCVELSVVVSKFAKVTNFKQITIVTDIVVVSPIVDKCEKPTKVVYVVQKGDTLYKIAQRYRTTVDAIIEANDFDDPDYLEVGQKIIIPKCIIDQPKG